MDSKHFRLLQPFILKGFTTVPQLCPKQIFLLFYTFFQYYKSKIFALSRTGLEPIRQTAESLYFKGFQRLLSQSCPKMNFIFNRGGFEAKLSSTTLYFKGIRDCVATVRQALPDQFYTYFQCFYYHQSHLTSLRKTKP